MHIGFRRSGGRGEYEVVGSHSGFTALSLEGWTFNLGWPDGIVRETGLGLEPATSGKPRLRSLLDRPFQIGRMAAAMLLLPDPRREFAGTGKSELVAVSKNFVLSRLGFGPDTEFAPVTDLVTIDPSFVMLENLDHKEFVGVEKRWRRIEAIYARASELPDAIQTHLESHRVFMAGGATADSGLESIVRRIAAATADQIDGHNANDDPLPGLEGLLAIGPQSEPALPPPDEIGEEEPEVSARSAHGYRLAKARGPSGRKFAKAVRTAYGDRCALCGGHFGGVAGIESGIDAAHILAWSHYDLDVISNGLALCKLHHWGFDAALLLPVKEGKSYTLRFTSLASHFDPATMKMLGEDGFTLPDDWLPAKLAERPSTKYLDKLYADLGVRFAS